MECREQAVTWSADDDVMRFWGRTQNACSCDTTDLDLCNSQFQNILSSKKKNRTTFSLLENMKENNGEAITCEMIIGSKARCSVLTRVTSSALSFQAGSALNILSRRLRTNKLDNGWNAVIFFSRANIIIAKRLN